MNDYYEDLGVSREATPEEITQNPRAASVRLRAVERLTTHRGDHAA